MWYATLISMSAEIPNGMPSHFSVILLGSSKTEALNIIPELHRVLSGSLLFILELTETSELNVFNNCVCFILPRLRLTSKCQC